MRKNIDPAPLADHGLINHLLNCLRQYGQVPATPSSGGQGTAQASNGLNFIKIFIRKFDFFPAPPAESGGPKASGTISIIISLLSSLCRGSPIITNILLEADVCSTLEIILQKDERCCLGRIKMFERNKNHSLARVRNMAGKPLGGSKFGLPTLKLFFHLKILIFTPFSLNFFTFSVPHVFHHFFKSGGQRQSSK